MKKHWLAYLVAWTGCLVFYICYQFWFAWLTLVAVSALPILSLGLSLPAMLTARMTLDIPEAVTRGTRVTAAFHAQSPFPLPHWQAKLSVGRELTKEGWVLQAGQELPTEHCGYLDCGVLQTRVYDYLGLFFRTLQVPQIHGVAVRPAPRRSPQLPPMHPVRALRWRARRGGGFSEHYELRLYQPGDNLRQIHWKLSGKTGKLLLRETMEPDMPPILGIRLVGTPAELDQSLEWLLWTALELLNSATAFRLLALTADGQKEWTVADESSLYIALDALLAQGPAGEEGQLTAGQPIHQIGGDAHES